MIELLQSLSALQIFYTVLLFMWIVFAWETYLALRQRAVYQTSLHVPNEVKGLLDEETFHKARRYQLHKSTFGLIESSISEVFSTGFLLWNGLWWLWDVSGHGIERMGWTPNENEIVHSMMFILVTNTFSTVLGLPFSVYSTFVLEQQHGFNKQTPGFFVKDKIKGYLVGQVIMVPLIGIIVSIIRWGGDWFFLYLWAFIGVFILFFMTVYPSVIAPLFDKYTPLAEGELRTNIENLALEIGFPLTKLYVVEGSKRSTHSNAYFYGFFNNKRIVLFDTLLQGYISEEKKEEEKTETEETSEKKDEVPKGCKDDEVVAVLAHELGHWKLNHVLKNIIIAQVNLFLVFMVFGALYKFRPLYEAFGFVSVQPVLLGLVIILQFIFAPYNEILSFLMTLLSRRFEFAADAFAVTLKKGSPLRSALIKLNRDNLGFPLNDSLFSAWHFSHPPLIERLRAIPEDGKRE